MPVSHWLHLSSTSADIRISPCMSFARTLRIWFHIGAIIPDKDVWLVYLVTTICWHVSCLQFYGSCSRWQIKTSVNFWWLIELPMWLTNGFLVTFFGRRRGQCTHMLIPVWLPYTVINMWGGGIANNEKLEKFGKLQIFIKVVGSIRGHIGPHEWQPSWIIKDCCHLI